MEWQEAVERRVARTGHERYRDLCNESHPNHLTWRKRLVDQESGKPPPPYPMRGHKWVTIAGNGQDSPSYPTIGQQLKNVGGAAVRVVSAFIKGKKVTVPHEVFKQRMDICMPCEFNGHRETGGLRCLKCGCPGIKLTLSTEECPVGKWGTWAEEEKGPADR